MKAELHWYVAQVMTGSEQETARKLTDAGMEIASRIYERHRLLSKWLMALGVSPETASEDACRIEHDVSDETFQKIKEHIAGRVPEE